MAGWRVAHLGFENDGLTLAGFPIWQADWGQAEQETVQLPHPAHPQQLHTYWVFNLPGNPPLRFAAGELSNGVWGFYVPA